MKEGSSPCRFRPRSATRALDACGCAWASRVQASGSPESTKTDPNESETAATASCPCAEGQGQTPPQFKQRSHCFCSAVQPPAWFRFGPYLGWCVWRPSTLPEFPLGGLQRAKAKTMELGVNSRSELPPISPSDWPVDTQNGLKLMAVGRQSSDPILCGCISGRMRTQNPSRRTPLQTKQVFFLRRRSDPIGDCSKRPNRSEPYCGGAGSCPSAQGPQSDQ